MRTLRTNKLLSTMVLKSNKKENISKTPNSNSKGYKSPILKRLKSHDEYRKSIKRNNELQTERKLYTPSNKMFAISHTKNKTSSTIKYIFDSRMKNNQINSISKADSERDIKRVRNNLYINTEIEKNKYTKKENEEFLNKKILNQNSEISIKELGTEENLNSIDADKSEKNESIISLKNISEESSVHSLVDKKLESILRKFMQAARKGDKEAFLEELAKINSIDSSYINFRDEQGLTALHYATEEGNLKIVEILMKSNADIQIKSLNKKTPLHISCLNGYFDISKILIENGAKLDEVDNEINTPLHLCVISKHLELLKYLLSKNPNATIKNIYGQTPVDLAKDNNIKFLLLNYLQQKKKNKKNNIFSNASLCTELHINCNNIYSNKDTEKNILSTSKKISKKRIYNFQTNNFKTLPNQNIINNASISSTNNNNNININISANKCNVLNCSEGRAKKYLCMKNKYIKKDIEKDNRNYNTNINGINRKRNVNQYLTFFDKDIKLNNRLLSPKNYTKSISKQIFNREDNNKNDLTLRTSKHTNKIIQFFSPENRNKRVSINNSLLNSNNKNLNVFITKSKNNQLIQNNIPSNKISRLTLNRHIANINNHIKSNNKSLNTNNEKNKIKKKNVATSILNLKSKIANVEINLNDSSER